jgi:hypothetical protein
MLNGIVLTINDFLPTLLMSTPRSPDSHPDSYMVENTGMGNQKGEKLNSGISIVPAPLPQFPPSTLPFTPILPKKYATQKLYSSEKLQLSTPRFLENQSTFEESLNEEEVKLNTIEDEIRKIQDTWSQNPAAEVNPHYLKLLLAERKVLLKKLNAGANGNQYKVLSSIQKEITKKYSGKESWTVFIFKFNKEIDQTKLDDKTKIWLLRKFLSDTASSHADYIYKYNSHVSYTTFVSLLAEKFRTIGGSSYSTTQRRLKTKEESYQVYFYHCNDLAVAEIQTRFPTLQDEELVLERAINIFLSGIDVAIRKSLELRAARRNTLLEEVPLPKIFVWCEDEDDKRRNLACNINAAREDRSNHNRPDFKDSEYKNDRKDRPPKYSNRNDGAPYQKPGEYSRHNKTQTESDRRDKNYYNNNRNQSFNKQDRNHSFTKQEDSRGSRQCYYCGMRGHYMRDCFHYKKQTTAY